MRAALVGALAALVAAPAALSAPVVASAYGAGLYGNPTACPGDGPFTSSSNVVAHRTLPCGTRVAVEYRGRVVVSRVLDRGPFIAGRDLDLGPAVWRGLGFPSEAAFGHRTVDLRVLPARPVRPVQTRRPPRAYPPRSVFAAQIRRRVAVLIQRYGEWPPPVWDATLTGQVAGWVLPQPPGSVPGVRSTCAPITSSTSRFNCHVSRGARLLEGVRVTVFEDGSLRVTRRTRY